MAEIHRLPAEQQVLREASEWIARLNADDLAAEDRQRFESWCNVHPMHRRAFEELAGTVERFVAVRPLVRAVAFGQSMNEAASELAGKPAVTRKAWLRLAWAAGIIGVALGLAWVGYLRPRAGHVYATAIGEHATISLSDGSTLELDSDSRARVQFTANSRLVRLDRGEAFFRVVHNARRPFWVLAGGAWVRDVGTAFNVDLDADGVRVTVSEGEVKVGAVNAILRHIALGDAMLPAAPALSVLTAGEEADLRGAAVAVQRLTPVQLAHAVSWRAGTLYFENQPLSAVVQQLKRYTPLDIEVTPHLRGLAVDGTFRASPQGVQTFLEMLHQGLGLSVRRKAGQVIIAPAATQSR